MILVSSRTLFSFVFSVLFAAAAPTANAQVVGCGEVTSFCFADGEDCPCGNDYEFGGCANSTGAGGIAFASGTGVFGFDDLVLTAIQLPENTPTVFFAGQVADRIPFRNGLLCMDPVRTKLLRLGAAQSAADGTATVGPGLIDYIDTEFPPEVGAPTPGSTWFFQGYYRDPGHCVSSANFTNAIAVTFASEPPQGTTRIGGRVFYDWNESEAYEAGDLNEDVIEGWKVSLDGPGGSFETYTDALGRYEFLVPMTGEVYTVTSIAPDPGYIPIAGSLWLNTGPDVQIVAADGAVRCADFGQIAFENAPELARSPDFWCTEEGRAFLRDCDPEWREALNDLCLRTNFSNPDGQEGTLFTVPLPGEVCTCSCDCDDDCDDDCDGGNSNGNGNGNGNGHCHHGNGNGYGHDHHGDDCDCDCEGDDGFDLAAGDLCEFLIAPTNGVLANQLSQQFITTVLNYTCGVLQGTVYIDRNLDGVLISLDELIAMTRELLCMPCAANSGPGGDEACRALIEGCLQEWEGTNSSGERIFRKADEKRTFETPY